MNKPLRVALIGIGYRGSYLLHILRSMQREVLIVGIADPSLGQTEEYEGIRAYGRGTQDYQRLISEQSPSLVLIASPWEYHIEQAMYAVEAGCHIALEIKPGLSTDHRESEYTALIALLEQRDKRCFPLENALFKREVLALWRMVEEGVLGELVHLRGGYRHDLRHILLDTKGRPQQSGEGTWRYAYYERCNADIYPTHGFAPLALVAGLGRTDSITSLYSQGSKRRGLIERIATDSPLPQLSDVITTHISTESGVLITLTHDTSLPRPRSLDLEIQGTRGIWDGERRRIYIEGLSPHERWEDDSPYIDRYTHPYWLRWGVEALQTDRHHEGMDYIMLRAVVATLCEGMDYPVDARDLALWCSITPLSAASIGSDSVLKLR